MSELNCTEALDSVRIRFKVLKQAKAGDIIVLDASGRWLLQSPSTWHSAFRKVLAFFSQSPMESQRQAFLKSAKESVRVMIHHSRLLMKTQLFNKATDPTGVISLKSMQTLNAADVSELEVLLSTVRSFCTDMHEGMAGLDNVIKHQPYADDLTFVSEIQVSLCDPVREFLEQTYRRMGIFGPKLLPFFNKPTQPPGAATATAAAPPTPLALSANNTHSALTGFVFAPLATTTTHAANPPSLPPTPMASAAPSPPVAPIASASATTSAEETHAATAAGLPRPLSTSSLPHAKSKK